MNIELKMIPISAIALDYKDNNENGVAGYGGNLNIRPPYQREFVYKDAQRNAVIDTILKDFPLNAMYWAKNEDGTYEVLDGQQRTISFCQYVNGDFSINEIFFHNLSEYEQEKIMNYKVMVFVCDGNDKERLDWFRRINVAGVELTDQELLNINYTGEWLSHAKRLFSKTNCNAVKVGDKYIKGTANRQEVLELALSWISGGKDNIAKYMSEHSKDSNANELWLHFSKVIEWVKIIFPNYRKEMKGLDWGRLYREYGAESYDTDELERQIVGLMADEDVTNKKGIFEYVLSRGKKERLLSIRAFSERDKRTKYEQQGGVCPNCGRHFEYEEMAGDHIKEWSRGGRTIIDNLQMLCKECHTGKTNRMRD